MQCDAPYIHGPSRIQQHLNENLMIVGCFLESEYFLTIFYQNIDFFLLMQGFSDCKTCHPLKTTNDDVQMIRAHSPGLCYFNINLLMQQCQNLYRDNMSSFMDLDSKTYNNRWFSKSNNNCTLPSTSFSFQIYLIMFRLVQRTNHFSVLDVLSVAP